MKSLIISISVVFFSILGYSCPSISISGTDVSCYLGSDGTATITITGDNGPFNVTWSNGQVNLNQIANNPIQNQGLTAGVYTVSVVDQLGCSSVNLIVIDQPNVVSGALASANNLCFGGSNGSISLVAQGGSGVYSYLWNNGSITQNLSNLNSGNYSVVITDDKGCKSSAISTTISEPSSAVSSAISESHVSCPNGIDGAVSLSVSGGTPPYNFNWNSGTYSTKDISGLSTGNYTVTITDDNGCTATNSTTISQPTTISSTISVIDVDCNGQNTGSLDITVNGGTSPYTYTWSNSQSVISNAQDLVNFPADVYSVEVKDNNNCIHNNSKAISQPAPQTINITTKDVSCNGYSDGEIIVNAQGGTPPYNFNWNGINTITANQLNIPANNYDLILTDFNNCVTNLSTSISEPASAMMTTVSKTDVLCFGNNTGVIDLSITGGTPPYTTSWSNGAFSEDITNLFANTYSLTALDLNNCRVDTSFIIVEPDVGLSNVFSVSHVSCNGFYDGNIFSNVSGGTAPYQYVWANSSYALSTTSSGLSNFPADNYFLEVTDNNGCKLYDTTNIIEPTMLWDTLIGVDILCKGESTGEINSNISGGTPPYSYSWDNGASSQNLQFLSAGNYQLQITDFNNCQITDSIILNEPISSLGSYYFSTDPLCYGSNDGTIDYFVTGGTSPYSYVWNNTQNIPNMINLNAGDYIVITTDANNCTLSDTIPIGQPNEISISAVVDSVTCKGDQNGSITVNVTGGTPGYSYQWSNSNFLLSTTSATIDSIPGGIYSLIVTDLNNCENSDSYNLYEPPLMSGSLEVKQITCPGADNGEISSTITGGNSTNYIYNWSNGESSADINNLPANEYILIASDYKGCNISLSATINDPETISITGIVTEVSCRDQSDGTISVEASGGAGNFSFSWDSGDIGSFIENLDGGNYTVTAVDALNCTMQNEFLVPINPMACINPPTVFSPQGDGINDTWHLQNIELYPQAQINIFNMWGTTVFQSTGYNEEWEGTYTNGNSLPIGTYYYIISLNNSNNTILTGPITILK